MTDTYDPAIRRFLEDPVRQIKLPYAREEGFLRAYLRHCVRCIDSDPSQGRDLVVLALRVISPHIAHSPCQTVLAWSLLSAIDRFQGKLRRADAVLDTAFEIANGHPECLAHLYRRRALIRRDQKRFGEAIDAADTSVGLYVTIGTDEAHEPLGNGPAIAFLWRGTVLYETYLASHDTSLLSRSVNDISQCLAVVSPLATPELYRKAVYNLAAALSATGNHSDLLLADDYLRQARRLFKGVRKCSQERAKLDWLTAMVRHQLGTVRPYRVRDMLSRSLSDFLEIGMPQECVAVIADMARIDWPCPDYRARIRALVDDVRGKLPLSRLAPEVCSALDHLRTATDDRGWKAHDNVKAAIEGLRGACGPEMIACLVTWR